MSIVKKLEAKDGSAKSQFSRFLVVGGVSTVINYAVFYVLYTMLSYNYIVASAAGYITGMIFGYYFNARITFKSRPGLSAAPYFCVYMFSLFAGLGVLHFFSESIGISPLVANILAIGFTTMTNFLGSRYIAFNPGFKLPPFFRSKIFLFMLCVKLVFAALFASDFLVQLFVPFVKYFVAHPFINPYDHFLAIEPKAFPYPPLMLYILSVPFVLFGLADNPFLNIFLMRLPLLFADIAIFYVLYKLMKGREKNSLLLYWASPVVFYITYVHGQLDIIPVAFLFLSAYMLTTRKLLLSAAMLGAALATKSFVLVLFPLFFIYLLRRVEAGKIIRYFAVSVGVFALAVLPYMFSQGFMHMVFLANEQFRLFNLSVDFGHDLVYYIVPAAYAYTIFKALHFKKLTRDILFALAALTMTILVTLIQPARGWYLWAVPFLAYFFVKEKRLSIWIYAAFNAAYLMYFLFVPDSDVFRVFQLAYPQIENAVTPYSFLISQGVPANLIANIFYTGLSSSLLYMAYIIYKNGIRNSFVFQESNGIPVIGISGDSGTGKTTLSESLANFFGRHKVTLLQGDDIHKWERGDENWNKYTHLNPMGNQIHMNYNQLKRLKNGRSIKRRHYDHKAGKFTTPIEIRPKDLIISEGLHTLFINESNSLYELKIYMDPDQDLKLWWKINRDTKERKYNAKQVMEQVKRRKPDSEKFISPQKFYSDIIISYFPEGKASKSDILCKVFVRNDIPIEQFISALSSCKNLQLVLDYVDNRFQNIVFGGTATAAELKTAMASMGVDYEEYEIGENSIKPGTEGVLQLLVLYCLNERLKAGRLEDAE